MQCSNHQVTLSTRNHFVFLEQFPQRKMIPRELKVQETVEFADQLGQEEAGNGTYIPTYIHNLFGEAGYKWDRLDKKS